jgi:hypothetical protein
VAVQYVKVRSDVDQFAPVVRPTGAVAIVGVAGEGVEDVPVQVTTTKEASTAFGDASGSALTRALHTALRQTPGPSQLWGVRGAGDLTDALTAVELLDVQFVVLADTPLEANSVAPDGAVTKLVEHVTTVSKAGDGKERMGVVMLPRDSVDTTLIGGTLADDRMVYVAHRSPADDVAAAVAGTIAGHPPHVSMVLKPVAVTSDLFTNAQLDSLNGVETFGEGPAGKGVNWLASPSLLPGRGIYLGEGYTGRPAGMKYIDVQRTVDDVAFRIKARLIRAIGTLRISRVGLRALELQLETVLNRLVADGVIEGYAITIPVLDLLDADPATLTEAQREEIQQAQVKRVAAVVVDIDYAGNVHRIDAQMTVK